MLKVVASIPIMTISNRPEDQEFGRNVASANKLEYHSCHSRDQVQNVLYDFPQAIIFWDADHGRAEDPAHPLSLAGINQVLMKSSQPNKVFALTSKPLNTLPVLSELTSFGHHIYRRFQDPATELYSRLLGSALISFPFGVDRYLPEGVEPRKILIKESQQKATAVQAVQNVLEKKGVSERLAALVAQATDELLLNAIFDAPVDSEGKAYRKDAPRAENIQLQQGEQIELSIAQSEKYFCLCVADQFGTLKKEVVLSFIRQNFKDSEYKVTDDAGSGLGLNGIIQSGLSLLFISRPKFRTEVMLFFPNVVQYRDFKKGFRFLSLLSE